MGTLKVVAACFVGWLALASQATADTQADRLDPKRALDRSEAAIGRILGTYSLTDTSGRPISLTSLRDKPLVVMEPFGTTEAVPPKLREMADEVVPWNGREMADAIRRQARHEDTTRWDVIEFKLD